MTIAVGVALAVVLVYAAALLCMTLGHRRDDHLAAQRCLEVARIHRVQRQANARITQLTTTALHQMAEAAHRQHHRPPVVTEPHHRGQESW